VTEVDRATRCITSWAVVWERTWDAMQEVIEGADPATQYYSDGFATYETLVYYPGRHAVAPGKSQTYSVEAANAELRHYLAPWSQITLLLALHRGLTAGGQALRVCLEPSPVTQAYLPALCLPCLGFCMTRLLATPDTTWLSDRGAFCIRYAVQPV